MNAKIDHQLAQVSAISQARASARVKTAAAIRQLEARLVTALGGATLRGLPDLAPGAERSIRAACVRGRYDNALPHDGHPILVLGEDGRLMMAMRFDDMSLRPVSNVHAWPAEDSDLLVEDFERLLVRVGEILENHTAIVGRGATRIGHLAALAERAIEVLKAS